MIAITIIFALFGWLTGVTINHAANILPTRKTLRQKPACLACGAVWPIVQWSALAARATGKKSCAACGMPRAKFSRSVIVEIATPAVFVFLAGRYGLSIELGLIIIYTVILELTTVTDLEHRLIFNIIMLPAILLALLASFVVPGLFWLSAVVGGVGAFIVVYLAALLSRGGLGEGDVTLSAFLGFALGFPHIVLSLTFGVFLGGVVALLLLVTRRVGLKTFIPYGPFLTITGWIMLVWGDEIWKHYFF